MHHRHVGLAAGHLGAAVEDKGGSEVHGGEGRLKSEKDSLNSSCRRPRYKSFKRPSNDGMLICMVMKFCKGKVHIFYSSF